MKFNFKLKGIRMKKIISIVALVVVGAFTGCTNSTPAVDGAEKVATTEVKKEASSQAVKVVKDKAISVAKTAAVGAVTKKAKEMASKK